MAIESKTSLFFGWQRYRKTNDKQSFSFIGGYVVEEDSRALLMNKLTKFYPLSVPLQPRRHLWDCCRESCSPFRVLRHRTPSSPIYLSEEIHKPFALSQVFLLSREGKSAALVKKKVPSRSGFPLSMYVVLKARYANPSIHVRRY